MGRGCVARASRSVSSVPATVLALSLFATACAGGAASSGRSPQPGAVEPGSDESTAEGSEAVAADERSTTTRGATADPAPESAPPPADGPAPADIRTLDRDGLLDRWAADRAAAVERITGNGWGVDDDNVLRGPGGLRVDLNDCPTGWADEGPDPNGESVPLSWWEPYHGPGVDNANDFLDWLGPEGHVDGRRLDLTAHSTYGERDPVVDGPYTDPTEPGSDLDIHNEDLVVETAAEAFAAVGVVAWHEYAGFEARFGRACLPSIGRRGSAEGDGRERSPWSASTLDLQVVDAAEAFARYAAQRHADDRIGVLVMDNDYGDRLAAPLERLGADGVLDVRSVRHDPAGDENQFEATLDELVATDPDIVVAATAGYPCTMALQGLRSRRPELDVLLPQYCDSIAAHIQPADAAGDGTLALRSTVEAFSPVLAGSALRDLADREYGGLEYRSGSSREWPLVWQTVQLLQIAAALPGGLTRSNVVLAAWSFDGRHPQMEGRATVSWPDKPRAVGALRLYRYSHAETEWQPTDTVVDLTAP